MKVLLGIPHTGTAVWNSSKAAWNCSKDHVVEVMDIPSSLLAMGFNILYVEALNRQEAGEDVLYGMLHADLAPQGFWLDTLATELLDRKADFVSAVNAIKDDRGLTSSGIAVPGHPWKALRRFTMTELADFPKTFNAKDVGFEGHVLLHNTGCWLADIRKPIFHEEDENGCLKAFFTINDRIRRYGTAKLGQKKPWRAEVEPEDWFYSRRLFDLGADTYITRKVVTMHYGLSEIDNFTVRGQAEDRQLMELWGEDMLEVARAGK